MCATVYMGCVCRPKDSLQDLVLAFHLLSIFSYFWGIQDNHSTFSFSVVIDSHRLEHNLVVELHTCLPLRLRENVDQRGEDCEDWLSPSPSSGVHCFH